MKHTIGNAVLIVLLAIGGAAQAAVKVAEKGLLPHMSFGHDEPIAAADWDEVRAAWNQYTKENQ